MKTKTMPPSSYRLSDEARLLLYQLAEKYSISQTSILEIIIREKAKKEKLLYDEPRSA